MKCLLCGYETESKDEMIKHFSDVHDANNVEWVARNTEGWVGPVRDDSDIRDGFDAGASDAGGGASSEGGAATE